MLGRGAGGLETHRAGAVCEHHADATAVMAPAGRRGDRRLRIQRAGGRKSPISAETQPHAAPLVSRPARRLPRPSNQHAVPQELVAAELLSLFC